MAALREAEVEAVAVCLLFAFLHPEHEQRVGRGDPRRRCPDVHVSLSSEVLPELREYERFATTAADAYLAPQLAAYLRNLAERRGGGRASRCRGSCSPPAASSTCEPRPPRWPRAASSRARPAASSAPRSPARRAATTTCSRSTWAARAPTWRRCRRRGADDDRRRRRRACRSAIRWSTCTRSARAAARSRAPTPAARCASARAPRAPSPGPRATTAAARTPTVTDANLFLGLLADGAELGGGEVVAAARAGRARAGGDGRAARARRAGDGAGRRARGRRRDGARAAGGQRRARAGPARVRARRVRRRRRDARVLAGRGAGHDDRAHPARGRRAERARAWPSPTCGATSSAR